MFFHAKSKSEADQNQLGLLLRGGIASGIVRISSVLLNFGLLAALVRLLGPADYGRYVIVFALVTILAVPLTSGLATYIVREIGRIGVDDPPLSQSVMQWGQRGILIYAMLVGCLAVVGLLVQSFLQDAEIRGRFNILTASLALGIGMAFTALFAAGLRGRGALWPGLGLDAALRPFLFLLAASAILMLANGATLHSTLLLHALSALAAAVIGWAIWSRVSLSAKWPAGRLKPSSRERLTSVVVLASVTGLQLLNAQIDLLVIGAFRAPAEAGIYRVAVQLASLVVFGLFVYNQVLHPVFSRLWADGHLDELQDLVTKSARIILALGAICSVGLLLIARPILPVLFGSDFAAAYAPMTILTVGQFTNVIFGSVGALLNMTGHERDTVKGMALALVVNTCGSLLLVPALGEIGAAISSAASYAVWNISLWIAVRRRLKLNTLAFGPRKIFKS